MADDSARRATAAGDAVLVVRDLECRRGERVLFAPVELRASPPATIVWLRGANGQGKTTLLRTLAGLSAPAAGRDRLGGRAPRSRRGRSTSPMPTR